MRPVQMLAAAGRLLEPLGVRVVFIGGATVSLHLGPLRASLARATLDVDCLVPAATLAEYDEIQAKLDELGIYPVMDEDAPLCRRRAGNLTLDVLPRDVTLIGMRGGFLAAGYDRAMAVDLPDGTRIHILRPADLMAAKVEAWKDRGRGDWMASADLEDLLSLAEGLPDFREVTQISDLAVRQCLAQWAAEMLVHPQLDTLLDGNVVGTQRLVPKAASSIRVAPGSCSQALGTTAGSFSVPQTKSVPEPGTNLGFGVLARIARLFGRLREPANGP